MWSRNDVNFLQVSVLKVTSTPIKMSEFQNTDKIKRKWPDMVAQPCNPSFWEAAAGRLL